MGGKSSKPIKNAFYEENISIINNLRKVEYFTNYKNEDILQIYIIFILTFMIIIGILYSNRKR
tara:strand:- start:4146 stop:4334 length:189 start_codon:yes stop_codon:yes gene_type:complete